MPLFGDTPSGQCLPITVARFVKFHFTFLLTIHLAGNFDQFYPWWVAVLVSASGLRWFIPCVFLPAQIHCVFFSVSSRQKTPSLPFAGRPWGNPSSPAWSGRPSRTSAFEGTNGRLGRCDGWKTNLRDLGTLSFGPSTSIPWKERNNRTEGLQLDGTARVGATFRTYRHCIASSNFPTQRSLRSLKFARINQ